MLPTIILAAPVNIVSHYQQWTKIS